MSSTGSASSTSSIITDIADVNKMLLEAHAIMDMLVGAVPASNEVVMAVENVPLLENLRISLRFAYSSASNLCNRLNEMKNNF
jgi:hypothetical protein